MTFKHIQANSGLLYQVFEQYDPDNLLLKQAKQEALNQQMEQDMFYQALRKLNQKKDCGQASGAVYAVFFPDHGRQTQPNQHFFRNNRG